MAPFLLAFALTLNRLANDRPRLLVELFLSLPCAIVPGEVLNIRKSLQLIDRDLWIANYCNKAKLPALNQCLNGKIIDYFIEIEMPGMFFAVSSSRMSLYESIYACVCLSISKSKINLRHSNWFGKVLRLHNAHNGNH